MALVLTVSLKDSGAKAALDNLAINFAHLKPMYRNLGEMFTTSFLRNFERGGRPAWPPLAPATIAERQKQKKWPGQILVRSGALKRIFYTADDNSTEIGTSAKYAATHQFGAKRGAFGSVIAAVRAHSRKGKPVRAHTRRMPVPWGNIPARPFLTLQPEDEQNMAAAIMTYLTRAINR